MSNLTSAFNDLFEDASPFNPLLKGDDSHWTHLPLPTQEELERYTTQLKCFQTPYLKEAGFNVEVGPVKSLARVIEKREGPKKPKVMPYFKAYSDLGRMQVEVPDIKDLFRAVTLLITDVNSVNTEWGPQFYIERNLYSPNSPDIVQRVNFYCYDVCEAPVEVWFGHPFALQVFAQNSYVRGLPQEEKENYFDWFGDNAYSAVKEAILDGSTSWKQIARDCVPEGKKHLIKCIME
jgi:hypothetical protein